MRAYASRSVVVLQPAFPARARARDMPLWRVEGCEWQQYGLTDVENELNGLLTHDRQLKVEAKRLATAHAEWIMRSMVPKGH